jgi:hypothetical protein
MMTIDFDTITVPTPAAYDSADPHKQRENFFYVLNQILDQCSGEIDIDLAEQIGSLAVTGGTFELPGLRITRSGRVVSFVMSP